MAGNVSDGVTHVIMRMMAKDPADRYADCKELLADLELVIDGKTPSSQAIDAGKSSVAVARARTVAVSPPVRSAGVSPAVRRASRPPLPSRDRGDPSRDGKGAVRPPADARGSLDEALVGPHGASVPPAAARSRKPVYIAAAVLGLGAITFIAALVSGGKSETQNPKAEGNAKTDTGTTKTAASEPAATTTAASSLTPQPSTGRCTTARNLSPTTPSALACPQRRRSTSAAG